VPDPARQDGGLTNLSRTRTNLPTVNFPAPRFITGLVIPSIF
jgi:hypothetical protein